MQVIDLPLDQLRAAPWSPNHMDSSMRDRLKESIIRYAVVQNFLARPLDDGCYEIISGNQRLQSAPTR